MSLPHLPAPRARRLVALAAGAALVLAAPACGDDDGDDTAADTTTTGGPDTADLTAYCEDEVTLSQLFQVDPEDPEAFEAALAEAGPVIERVIASSPQDVADEVAVLSDVYDQVVADGDPTPFFTPEVAAADAAIYAHDVDACGWDVVAVEAAEFAFTGDFPTSAATVSFELDNAGTEPHVLVVARKHDDVSGSALEVFEGLADHDALLENFEVAASVFAAPGDSDYGVADLAPGEYVVFCPIPVGTTDTAEGDGPPHFTMGMVSAFEVSR